jgi:hypothetical protein
MSSLLAWFDEYSKQEGGVDPELEVTNELGPSKD